MTRALMDLAPAEEILYVGDTGRYPYGTRDQAEVRGFARQISRLLVEDLGTKMVVVACNTATAAALDALRDELPVPVLGVIAPGLRAAAGATRNGRIGVIATEGTIASGAYQRAGAALGSAVELHCVAGPGLVELVEAGETDGDRALAVCGLRLEPLRRAGVDTLLLGCTHYPFLARTIADVMGRRVVLVSSAEETAFEVRSVLESTGRGRRAGGAAPRHRFWSSGEPALFVERGRRLLGPELDRAGHLAWHRSPAYGGAVRPGAGRRPMEARWA